MWGFDLSAIPGLDMTAGTFTLPLWAAGVAAALVVVFLVIALFRSGLSNLLALVVRIGAIVLVVVFAWYYLDRAAEQQRAEERRSLDQRGLELTSRSIVPGSALACLDATSGDSVEGACERAVFANAETVAAATALVGARLALLNDANDFANRNPSYQNSVTLAGLQRTISADRFGLVAHVLATRDGCTFENCDAFVMVNDANRLRANLRERTFDALVARYATNWPTRARAAAPSTTSMTFPPAASMPPVPNSESPAPAQPFAATPPAPSTPASPAAPANTQPAAQKRPPPAKTAQPRPAPPPPVQLGPPPSASEPPPARAQ